MSGYGWAGRRGKPARSPFAAALPIREKPQPAAYEREPADHVKPDGGAVEGLTLCVEPFDLPQREGLAVV